MSLARLALRLGAMEALRPWASVQGAPYPTPAGPRVYDSRQNPIDGLSDLETKPILIVYTEEDVSTPYEGGRRTADDQIVVLVVEIMIAARGQVEVDNPEGGKTTIGTLVSGISDPEQEALLDLVEAAVRRLLDVRNRMPTAGALSRVATETRRIESQPLRADDKATRLAARTLKFHLKVRADEWPSMPATPAPAGLAALPDPLRTVAGMLDPASEGGAICAGLAVQIAGPPPAPDRFSGIDITSDVDLDPANKDPVQIRSRVDAPRADTPA